MIKSIKELQDYLLKDAEDFEELMMTSPGCSKEEIDILKKTLPGIPDSYTKWVEAVNLNGISVGCFGTSPFSFNPEGMVANLIEGNEEGVMFWEYTRQYHLYSIVSCSDVGVFVATVSSPYKEGEIIAIDGSIYVEKDHPEQCIFRIAKDFEQFLIIAGNLNQLHREINEDNSNYGEKEKKFIERLKILGVAEEYHTPWMMMF
ncbi:MAG: SMI1/KNR4 family protein [Proteobacteria bacterium]|nr:SMI1/KNR4 family protein [Pseudomonadota bacterium]